ncbi:MAG: hypothetical protein HDQ97_11110 [Lachnospiraceae bacterium]|nr:hypothetical protein [Lachnospiraceae bacterium]
MRTIFDKETEGGMQNALHLVTWKLPDKQFVLELPEGFAEIDEEKKEENYPLSDRPEIILEDEQGEVQLTLQFFYKVMKTDETKGVTEQIHELMENTYVQYPSSQVYLDKNGEIPIGWFLMRMSDLKKEHIKAVFSIKRHMALLTLTYPEEESWKWRAIKDYIFISIKEESNGTGYE